MDNKDKALLTELLRLDKQCVLLDPRGPKYDDEGTTYHTISGSEMRYYLSARRASGALSRLLAQEPKAEQPVGPKDLIQVLRGKLWRWQRIDAYWRDINARLANGEKITTMSPDPDHAYNAATEISELLKDYP